MIVHLEWCLGCLAGQNILLSLRHTLPANQEQFRIQCLPQGHLVMWSQTTKPVINGHPAIPLEPQLSLFIMGGGLRPQLGLDTSLFQCGMV